jgi:hypothetical protein
MAIHDLDGFMMIWIDLGYPNFKKPPYVFQLKPKLFVLWGLVLRHPLKHLAQGTVVRGQGNQGAHFHGRNCLARCGYVPTRFGPGFWEISFAFNRDLIVVFWGGFNEN